MKIICFLLIILCFFSFQKGIDENYFLGIWSLDFIDKKDFRDINFNRESKFRKNTVCLKYTKNGVVYGNLSPIKCMVGEKKIEWKKVKGTWRKINDSTIRMKFPINTSFNNMSFVVKKVSENKLVLRMFVNTNKN